VRRLGTPRWLLAHAGTALAVVTFLALGWWQVGRAASGNLLSYGYAIQWPAFAVFVVFLWIREARRALAAPDPDPPTPSPTASPAAGPAAAPARPRSTNRAGPAYDDSDDEQLAAYNRYLAWLAAHPGASPRDYPG
jgi:hypothetical protein